MTGKKYIFCGNWAGLNTVGVHRYAFELLKELDGILSDGTAYDVEFLIPRDAKADFTFENIRVTRRGILGRDGTLPGRILSRAWKDIVFPVHVLFHGGTGVDLALALPAWRTSVYAIHDCIREKYYGEISKSTRSHRTYLRRLNRVTSDGRNHIITVSEYSKKDIMDLYGVPEERISIIGNGWEHMLDIQEDMSVFERIGVPEGGEYFMSLAFGAKHKNADWIMRAAEQNPKYTFVIAGKMSDEICGGRSCPDNVIFTGYLEDEEIKALMMRCKALIQPSYYEGFGIPPLEAIALGSRAIVSDATALPEIFGDSAVYLDPDSTQCNMDELMKDIEKTSRDVLERHSWKKAGEKLNKLLEELV